MPGSSSDKNRTYMEMVVRCLHALAAAVQSSDSDFSGPFRGKTHFVNEELILMIPVAQHKVTTYELGTRTVLLV